MSVRHWLAAEREPGEAGLVGYRRQLLLFLAIATFYGAWLLFLWMPDGRTSLARGIAVVGCGLALAGTTFLLRRSWPRLASCLYVLGSLVFATLVCVVFGQPATQALFPLTVLLAGLLLGVYATAVVAVVAAGLVLALNPNALSLAAPSFWLVLIAISAGLGILTGRALAQLDHWEREVARGQRELIEKMRDRQGELNRTLKALDEAYELLKRSNHELTAARQAADEARAVKEQFVANISHELRTPLNLIVGFAEVMHLTPEIYGDVRWTRTLAGDIQEIYRASRHLQSLVEDILDLSRIDAARLPMYRELQDVRAIIAEAGETIAPLLKQRGLSYSVQWPEELPRLFVDRMRIRQVLLNLLNNAIRHTERGGLAVQVEKAADTLVVSVRDSGSGIPADQLESVFERFHQLDGGLRRAAGAGLGLALSRQFVELHGGRMWAESQVGQGSTFSFALPLPGAVPQTTSLLYIPEGQPAGAEAAPVLVVDPDPAVGEMISRYLGDRRVLPAADAEQAEALIEAEHPLAVIVNQPPDAPGHEWLAPLGEHGRRYGVPVLRCSIPSPSWLKLGSGLDACLAKPVSRATLSRLLGEHPARGRILVVDDDPGFVRLMGRLLNMIDRDAEVLTAYSGAQAVRLASERVPDIVLLDLVMPEMDGFAVLQALRADPALVSTRIVAVTATSYAEDALQQRGMYLTLTQPLGLSPGTLVELLRDMLRVVKPNYVLGEG